MLTQYLTCSSEKEPRRICQRHTPIFQKMRLVDAPYPDAVLLAEACMSPEELLQYLREGNEFQMAFHFALMSCPDVAALPSPGHYGDRAPLLPRSPLQVSRSAIL